MVVPSLQKIKPSDKVPHKIYQVPFNAEYLDNLIQLEIEGRKLQVLFRLSETITGLCEGPLNSTELLKELKGFDLIVYDTAFCGPLVGELLGIPRVEIFPFSLNMLLEVYHMKPMPISYVPQLLTGFTDKMTFMARVLNLGAYLVGKLFARLTYDRIMNALKVKYNITPERSYQETAGDVEMVLITADFALEYPQPLMPGVNYRGLGCKCWYLEVHNAMWQNSFAQFICNLLPRVLSLPSTDLGTRLYQL